MSFWSDQLNTKTINSISIDELDKIFDNIQIQDSNLEDIQTLVAIKEAAGFRAGSPFKGTSAIKRNDMTDAGIANFQVIHQPEAGQVWMMVGSSVQIATFADGSHTFLISTFDNTNRTTFIESTMQNDSLVNEPILNEVTSSGSREGGYNAPIFYDSNNYLTVHYLSTASSQTQDPVICTQVVRVQ